MTGPVIVASWAKNGRETVQVRLDEFNGHDLISIRTWWTDKHGELKPGKTGFAISVKHLPALAEAVAEAEREARRLGLLPAGGPLEAST